MTLTPSQAAALHWLREKQHKGIFEWNLVLCWKWPGLWAKWNITRMVRKELIARNPTTRHCLITPLGLAALREWEDQHAK